MAESAIGFAMAVVGFLINTAPRIYQTVNEVTECERRLNFYRVEFAYCKSQMVDWIMLWKRDPSFTEEVLRYFWSTDYSAINTGWEEVGKLSSEIKRMLRVGAGAGGDEVGEAGEEDEHEAGEEDEHEAGEEDEHEAGGEDEHEAGEAEDPNPDQPPTGRHWRIWRRLVRRKKFPENPKRSELSAIGRVLFALFDNQTLAGRIDRLKRTIDNVKSLGQTAFKRLHGDDRQVDVTLQDVQEAKRLMIFMKSLGEFGKVIHDWCAQRQGTQGWALELRPPDTHANVARWDSTARVDVGYTFSVIQNGVGLSQRRLKFYYQGTQAMQVEDLDDAEIWNSIISGEEPRQNNTLTLEQPPSQKSQSLREHYMEGFFDSPEVYKAWEGDRARLALGLLNWAILLWDTEWTKNPCCCGIRLIKLTGPDPASVPTLEANEHENCNANLWKLQAVGILLAEVILAIPLRGLVQNDLIVYEEGKRAEDGHNAWTAIDRNMILQKLDEKTQSDSLVEAVRFCLDERSNLATGDFQSQYVVRLNEFLFKPVQSWCKIRCQDEEYHKKVMDYVRQKYPQFQPELWPEPGPEPVPEPLWV